MKIEYHHLIASVSEGEVLLQQTDFAGNEAQIVISPAQLLAIADKLRGIVRPSPEAEESRKLRVISDKLSDFIAWDGFADCLIKHSSDGAAYYTELTCINDLLTEYAYGLQPDNTAPKPNGESKAPQTPSTENGQADLLNV